MATPHINQFHALARVLRRLERSEQLQKALRTPGQALREAWWDRKTFQEGSAYLPQHSSPGMLLHFYKLAAQYGYSIEEYFRYRLYLRQHHSWAFIPLRSNIAARTHLYETLSLDPAPLADKRLFYRHCAEVGLPVPITVADAQDGTLCWWSSPKELPACDLFLKEAASLCGAGAALWTYQGEGAWRNEAQFLHEGQLVDELEKLSHKAPIILQRKVINHPEIADLSPGGLCTARVVTLADPSADNFRVLTAVFRMPADDSIVDNFQLGGLACPIDLETGAMGLAARKKLSGAHIDLQHHPATGAPIYQRQLYRWKDIAVLALDAHRAYPQYPSVGWDVAISTEGLRLIEGNYNWGIVLPQQTGLRPLGETEFAEHYLGWLRAAQAKPVGRICDVAYRRSSQACHVAHRR